MSVVWAGWQESCVTGLKTSTYLHSASIVQASQMYNYHNARAVSHISKIITFNILDFTTIASTTPSSSTENGAMGIGLEYV